jgi:N-acetylglucosaminyl-diphospho-decaprenol L-rhamnosyltransferase
MLDLAIIVVNYKTPILVTTVLGSLISEVDPNSMLVIVVDNYSQDNSLNIISKWVSDNNSEDWVKLIDAGENTGFSGGNNIGIKSVKTKNYLLLNSDTVVRPGTVSKLLYAAKQNKNAGLISPRLEWESGEPQQSCFNYHSPLSEFISSAGTGFIESFLKKHTVSNPISDIPNNYDWCSFACILIKSEVIEQIGLLDDQYFMYFEDVAFSYHANLAGWKVLNIPSASVVHLRGGSSTVKLQKKMRNPIPRYYYESRTRFFYQVYGHSGLFLANILWTAGRLISLVRQSVNKSYVPNASFNQWRDIWINFLNPTKPYIHPDKYDKT